MRNRRGFIHRWPAKAIGLLVLALLPQAAAIATNEAPNPRLIALDVGEGQSLLLARGDRGVLIDTGRPGMGQHVLERLRANGVDHLEAVIYTHLHPDHAGSWFRIEEAFPRVQVIESGHRRAGTNWPDTSRWVANALDRLPKARHRTVQRGDTWSMLGLRFRVLWPDTIASGGLNERSLVLDIRNDSVRALIMGDVGIPAERRLLETDAIPLNVDVLVAGHHGSADTSSTALLKRTSPGFTIVSTDANNIRGYPAGDTVERLRQNSRQLLRTWVDGEICIELGESSNARRC